MKQNIRSAARQLIRAHAYVECVCKCVYLFYIYTEENTFTYARLRCLPGYVRLRYTKMTKNSSCSQVPRGNRR